MTKRIIKIDGPFSRETATAVIDMIDVFNAQGPAPIFILIDSYGGDAVACFGIADAVKRSAARVITVVIGKAMSAGATVLVNGSPGSRFAMPNARIMLHEPRGQALISSSGVDHMGILKNLQTTMLADRLDKSVAELEEMLDRDAHYDAQQALDMGLIDGIFDAEFL